MTRQQRRRVKLTADGICYICAKNPINYERSNIKCDSCLDQCNESKQCTRTKRMMSKMCPDCGLNPIDNNQVKQCPQCAHKANKSRRSLYRSRKETGVCVVCGEQRVNSSLCALCLVGRIAIANLKTLVLAPQLLDKLKLQNHTCAYTGEVLILGVNATIDHIKPVSKYPELVSDIDNIVWCTKSVNQMKHNLELDEFYHICKLVLETKEIVQ